MISFEQARSIGLKQIEEFDSRDADLGGLRLQDEATIETPFAWIFFWNSKKYIETGDFNDILAGNCPLFISKTDGQLHTYPTGYCLEDQIDMYEEMKEGWRLDVAADLTLAPRQLLQLRAVLGLTLEQLSIMKSVNPVILTKGAKTRLEGLQAQLKDIGIDTIISLNFYVG